jgi:hypothetical protein
MEIMGQVITIILVRLIAMLMDVAMAELILISDKHQSPETIPQAILNRLFLNMVIR